GEFSLLALCCNVTRVLNILGMSTLRNYCVQRSKNKTVIHGCVKMEGNSSQIGAYAECNR
ncbi:MAG: hypothetical protein LUQ29_03605, partial [Methylococcaceae bacterium]|nr:hypothetical protein [Methylococcaceae bacterium]